MNLNIESLMKGKVFCGKGFYARYYKLNNDLGMKLFNDSFVYKQSAKLSNVYENALMEHRNLVKVKKLIDIVPKSYGVHVVFYRNKYRIGLLMQHLDGIELEKKLMQEGKHEKFKHWEYPVQKKIRRKLEAKGILHDDLHDSNIIYSKGKYWVIDWSKESYVRFFKIK